MSPTLTPPDKRIVADRPQPQSRRRRRGSIHAAMYVVIGLLLGASPQAPAPRAAPAQNSATIAPLGTQPPSANSGLRSASSAMDPAIQVLNRARQSYERVRDYQCLFVKQERMRGQLQPENLMTMKVRTQPFGVHFLWHAPKSMAGQEVCYVPTRNNGMMRVKSTGLLKAIGFVNIDPRDPRALENSRHSIDEAGIGNLLERLARGWENERRLNRTQVTVAEYEYNKKRCTRIETVHVDNAGGTFHFYRSIFYFDQESGLPIRVENYDWPRPGSDPRGDLLESYSYADLRLNIGLGDESFNF